MFLAFFDFLVFHTAPYTGHFRQMPKMTHILALFRRFLKFAENAIFGTLAEAKMGVRVTKNPKKSKISKILPKTFKSLNGTYTMISQGLGERWTRTWPNTLKGGGVLGTIWYIYIIYLCQCLTPALFRV